jgi:hypothetical protein
VIRSPRTQGLPPRFPGSIVMMSEYVMLLTVFENPVPSNRKLAALAGDPAFELELWDALSFRAVN